MRISRYLEIRILSNKYCKDHPLSMKFNAHSFLGQPLQNTISAKYLAEIKSISQKTGVTWILCKEIPELLKSELSEKILAMNNIWGPLQGIRSRLRSVYFAQTIIRFPEVFFYIEILPSPVQRKSFLNRNVLSSVHSLAAIFNFCFYCRECEQNVSFAM